MFKVIGLAFLLIGAANLTDVTYYEILGISKQASTQEIRQAYKKLAVKFHPDKNPGVEEKGNFLKINEAYETLKDTEKRRNYDIYGSYPSYSRKYDHKSQSEYDNLYYNGLYHNDPFVDTLSGAGFYNYLNEGFHFINFYSPFCPPCQNVADHWKKLAEMYKGIVKIAAVNCKYHNSFCYNSMRIGSYPTLLFYPNGRNGNYIYYRGDRTLEALDNFVMSYVKDLIHVPTTVTQLRSMDKPIAYVLGTNRVGRNALMRIAYHLKGLVTVVIVENDNLREKLTDNEYTTVVFKYKAATKDIDSTDEKSILKEIVESLPSIEMIDPGKLKDIRNQLRRGGKTPWVLYFSTKGHDKLQLHQMKNTFPHMNFGEVDCDKWSELCASLQVDIAPAWALLNRGGGYYRAPPHHTQNIQHFITTAAQTTTLHTLSASDFTKILDGDMGLWVLLVAPYKLSWEDLAETFTRASSHFNEDDDISFGIMACTLNNDKYCRQVAHSEPTVLVQNGTKQIVYKGQVDEKNLLEFIRMLRDSVDLELDEQEVLEILDPSGRDHTWLVAFLPYQCGRFCDDLVYEWMRVADKLRPLEFVRVGVLRCTRSDYGFCANVRAATARLYPLSAGHHYSVSLQHLSQAPYILEWALQYIDDSVQKLNWHSFTKTVIAEELNPSSGKKPWLVYFHSPRCYRCYEMYADFAIAGVLLNNAVDLGKVNCLNERGLCQHEQVNTYPSLKLYLGRNHQQSFSSVVNLQVRGYQTIIEEIKAHIITYDKNLLAGLNIVGKVHDEF